MVAAPVSAGSAGGLLALLEEHDLQLQVAALRAPDGVMLSLVEAAAAVGAGEGAE